MKIALSGYYGFDNAGDEALLSAITSTIKKLAPGASFVVLSGHPGKTLTLHGLRSVNRMNPRSVIRELISSDLLISGGGSLFQDVTGPFSLPYYASIVALAKILGKPVIFYAQGIGPINRNFSKFIMNKIGNWVDFITLRDEKSLTVLNDLGITRPPVKVTADPVFTLEPEQENYWEIQNLLASYQIKPEKLIGVSVREWAPLKQHRADLARLLDTLVKKGYQIVFIPMDYPKDLQVSKQVAGLMQEAAIILDKNLSSLEHLALISYLDLVIGMRLHALIFAANREIPFLGISYDPKIDAFVESFDLKPLSTSYSEMLIQVEELLEDKNRQESIKLKSRELKQRAEETAHLALALIKK